MKTMAEILDESRSKNTASKCATCKHSVAMGGDGWNACEDCIYDEDRRDRYEPASNANYIRSMSDEELAKFLFGVWDDGWRDGFSRDPALLEPSRNLEWLKQIYKEGTLL